MYYPQSGLLTASQCVYDQNRNVKQIQNYMNHCGYKNHQEYLSQNAKIGFGTIGNLELGYGDYCTQKRGYCETQIFMPQQTQRYTIFYQPPPIFPIQWTNHYHYLQYLNQSMPQFNSKEIVASKNYLLTLIAEPQFPYPVSAYICLQTLPQHIFAFPQLHFLQSVIEENYPLHIDYLKEYHKIKQQDENQLEPFVDLLQILCKLEFSHLSGNSDKFMKRLFHTISIMNQQNYSIKFIMFPKVEIQQQCQIYSELLLQKNSIDEENLPESIDILYYFVRNMGQKYQQKSSIVKKVFFLIKNKYGDTGKNKILSCFATQLKLELNSIVPQIGSLIQNIFNQNDKNVPKSQAFMQKRVKADMIRKVWANWSDSMVKIIKFLTNFVGKSDILIFVRMLSSWNRLCSMPLNQYATVPLQQQQICKFVWESMNMMRQPSKEGNKRMQKVGKITMDELDEW